MQKPQGPQQFRYRTLRAIRAFAGRSILRYCERAICRCYKLVLFRSGIVAEWRRRMSRLLIRERSLPTYLHISIEFLREGSVTIANFPQTSRLLLRRNRFYTVYPGRFRTIFIYVNAAQEYLH